MISASPQQKLLGEYTFQSVEDESEEKVVEKYSREGKEYTLTADKQSGKKHGKAELADESLCVIAKRALVYLTAVRSAGSAASGHLFKTAALGVMGGDILVILSTAVKAGVYGISDLKAGGSSFRYTIIVAVIAYLFMCCCLNGAAKLKSDSSHNIVLVHSLVPAGGGEVGERKVVYNVL